ncbi:FLYWCH-type domain-containing protein [Aphis craccivora]|uniref:FLYWCH-type domain-containing protein n=1 Tax=Aphis craccivora TaxID=307492 RepID=A0A6G0Z8F5_APHCR|nr:FLYWCH-type domain-containing protein [Aphis craccivora]
MFWKISECSNSSQRTTNACEAFDSKFNSYFYSSHSYIFQSIGVLKSFQINTHVLINSINTSKTNYRKKKTKFKINKEINKIIKKSSSRHKKIDFSQIKINQTRHLQIFTMNLELPEKIKKLLRHEVHHLKIHPSFPHKIASHH